MLPLLLCYLLIINAAGLLIMLADKQKAKKHLWRIPEAALLAVAALGGSLGVLAGMKLFRHKTRKPKFRIGVPAILCLQILLSLLIWAELP